MAILSSDGLKSLAQLVLASGVVACGTSGSGGNAQDMDASAPMNGNGGDEGNGGNATGTGNDDESDAGTMTGSSNVGGSGGSEAGGGSSGSSETAGAGGGGTAGTGLGGSGGAAGGAGGASTGGGGAGPNPADVGDPESSRLLWTQQIGITDMFNDVPGAVQIHDDSTVTLAGWNPNTAYSFSGGGDDDATTAGGPYVARYTDAGALSWFYQFANKQTEARGLATSPSGELYVGGLFLKNDTTFFGNGSGNAVVRSPFTYDGVSDGYLIQLAPPSGSDIPEMKWVVTFGGSGLDSIHDVALRDPGGTETLVVCGAYSGGDNLLSVPAAIGHSSGAFVGALDTAGNALWMNHVTIPGTSPAASVCFDLAVDPDGNIYVVGNIQGGTRFHVTAATPGNALTDTDDDVEVSPPDVDGFVAKYSADGALEWLEVFGGGTDANSHTDESGFGIAYDANSDAVVFTGNVQGMGTIGGVELAGHRGAGLGYGGAFVAKLDAADGAVIWAKEIDPIGPSVGQAVEVDGAGNIVVSGTTQVSFSFADAWATTAGTDAYYMVSYDTDGEELWSQQMRRDVSGLNGAWGRENGQALAVSEDGTLVAFATLFESNGAMPAYWADDTTPFIAGGLDTLVGVLSAE